jgi:flagellar operon protein
MTTPLDRLSGASPLPPSVAGPGAAAPAAPAWRDGAAGGAPFAERLRQSAGGVEFSKHALERIQRRGIATDPTTMARLGRGVDLAAAKGAREAVVMVDNSAFVVSVRNRAVITAIDQAQMRDHVFTNIDSAVVA